MFFEEVLHAMAERKVTTKGKVEVSVLLVDLENCLRRSRLYCPLAFAIKRKIPMATYVNVGNKDVSLCLGGIFFYFNLPAEAIRFVQLYDNRETTDAAVPFTFEMEES